MPAGHAAKTLYHVAETYRKACKALSVHTWAPSPHRAAEVRGWFAPTPPSSAELVRVATKEAAALRRLWAHDLRERRLLRLQEGFAQIAQPAVVGADEGGTPEVCSILYIV